MKNMIGGEVKQVSWDQLIELAPKQLRTPLCDLGETTNIIVVFRVDQMDSSSAGQLRFVRVGGHLGNTFTTLEEAVAGRVGDAPSRFAYPFAYWSRT